MKYLELLIVLILFQTVTSYVPSFNISISVQGQEYVNSCTSNGAKVCMNCGTVGICIQSGSTYSVTSGEICFEGSVCFLPDGGDALCTLVNPALVPECTCNNGNPCEQDPYDSLSYVICNPQPQYRKCTTGQAVNLDSCSCESVPDCPSCGSYSNSATDCSSFTYCKDGTYANGRCPGSACFNPTDCTCGGEEQCPACGFTANPDDPSKFYYCAEGTYVPGTCNSNAVFDSTNCVCVSDTVTPTTTSGLSPTTPSVISTNADPCAYCGKFPDNDDPTKYYKCVDGVYILTSCPQGFYFDPVTCFCS